MEEECKCVSIDYEKEYEVNQWQIKQLTDELEKYKQALLNICLKV